MASFKTIIKRLNYYLNQLLEEKDFLDQQDYHRQLRLYHNELLHTAGVVEGLEVTKDGSNKFKVSEGMAIDPQGRELIWTKETQSFNLTDTNTTVFVTIKYEEKESDPDAIITGKSRRITEEPKIEIKTTKPNDRELILLATVSLDSSGNIIGDPNNSVQVKAGAKIPEKAITSSMLQSELTVSKKVGIGTDTPTEALEVKGKVKLEQGTSINEFSTDSTLTDNSNLAIPTEQAVKTYVDAQINQANQVIASKANSSDLTTQINQVNQVIASKANSSDLTAQINQVNQVIASKANSSDLTTQINQVNQVIASKADLSFVNHQIDQLHTNLSTGKVEIGNITINSAVISTKSQQGTDSRLHLTGNERLYLLPRDGVWITRDWESNGNLFMQGKLTIDYPPTENSFVAMSIDVGSFVTSENAQNSYYLQVRDIGAGGQPSFYIRGDGHVYMTSFSQASSKELKENIEDISVQESFSLLEKLNPVKFSYCHDPKSQLKLGFIAEEVPDLLAAEDKKSLNPLEIVAALTKVVQEQQKMLQALQDKIQNLEKREQ